MIVVGGESLVDLISRAEELHAVPGGGPYNVARTIARLGVDCAYLGSLSTDRFGARLRAGLREDGVDDRWAPETGEPTTLAVAQIGADGAATYSFYVESTSAADLSEEQALAVLADRPEVVYVGTLGLALEPAARSYEALVGAVGDGTLVAVDPNCRPGVVRDAAAYLARVERVLRRADLVKVSTDDLAYLTPGLDALTAAEQLLSWGPAVVLVTDGSGDVHVLAGGHRVSVAVPPVGVVDTVGAGDSFLGAVLAHWSARGRGRDELADGDAVLAAVRFGIAVSAITCARVGADPPRAGELPPDLSAALAGHG